jgi:hypothetical protein
MFFFFFLAVFALVMFAAVGIGGLAALSYCVVKAVEATAVQASARQQRRLLARTATRSELCPSDSPGGRGDEPSASS